jgi:hypothetical protein
MLETHVVHLGSKSKRSESVHATQFLLSSIAVYHPKYKCRHENWEGITGGSFMSYVRHIYTPVITVTACQMLCSSEQVIICLISKLCRPLLKLFSCTLKFVFDKLCYKNCGSYHTHMSVWYFCSWLTMSFPVLLLLIREIIYEGLVRIMWMSQKTNWNKDPTFYVQTES